MTTITVPEAFSNAPPRSAAVLCVKGSNGRTVLRMTDWFTWLNIKRNPMISFSLQSDDSSFQLRPDDSLVLAFPPLKEAKRYREPVYAAKEEQREDSETMAVDGLDVLVPRGSDVLLCCTLSGSYKYPFKKVRIYNCNLEEAKGHPEGIVLE